MLLRLALGFLLCTSPPALCSENYYYRHYYAHAPESQPSPSPAKSYKTESTSEERSDLELGVIDGDLAPVGRFPYACSLRKRGTRRHVCGGTLIRPRWVLTAAHCVDPRHENSTGYSPIVYCGIYELDTYTATTTFWSVKTLVHEKWTGNVTNGYDLVLLKLNRKANFAKPALDTVGSPFPLWHSLSGIGWGRTEITTRSEFLRMANTLLYVSEDDCKSHYDIKDRYGMMCAGLLYHNSTCSGDGGSPLFVADRPYTKIELGKPDLDLVIGVLSFGPNDCDTSKPAVYTNVFAFIDWIKDTIQSNDMDSAEDMESGNGNWQEKTQEMAPIPEKRPTLKQGQDSHSDGIAFHPEIAMTVKEINSVDDEGAVEASLNNIFDES